MTNFKFAKVRDKPFNRDGETSEGTFTGTEGDVIGLTENADGETEVVGADAAAASAQPAMGVLLENVRNRSYWSTNLHDNGTMSRQIDAKYQSDYTLPGDEVTYIRYGIYLENVDADTDFVPNEPVYLAAGGGVTQTPPSSNGDLVQRLGTAVNATTFYLNVEDAETVDENVGDVALDGDATNGKTTFVIPHGLSSAPTDYNVEATSVDAQGDYYVSNLDADSIDITYGTAPADGTGNVGLHFYAQE